MRYFVFIVYLMLICLPTHAQVYKWVDSNGKTQYSDQPPQTKTVQNEQKIKIQSAPAPVPKVNAESDEETENLKSRADERIDYDKRRQERLEKKSQQKALAEENKQKCVDAQSRLKVFSESPRLRMPDGKGGLVYVDDNARQQKINEAKESVNTFCN